VARANYLLATARELGLNLSKLLPNTKFNETPSFGEAFSVKRILWWAGPDLNRRPSARQASPKLANLEMSLNWEDFKDWVQNKYSKTWAPTLFGYAKKYHEMLSGSLRELDAFSKSKKNNVLKALIALSKYLGAYEQFKIRMANYGIKWENQNSLESFLRIMNAKGGVIESVKASLKTLDDSYATFIKFAMISGLRKSEAIQAFNMVIRLHQNGSLNEYYNPELQSLEHFRFESAFIRGSKNVFFSFIPRPFIEQIASCEPISESGLKRRMRKHGLNLRLNELRDFFATFMVSHGIIREEADILQGRIGKSLFMKHYFSPAIKDLRDRDLNAVNEMMKGVSP